MAGQSSPLRRGGGAPDTLPPGVGERLSGDRHQSRGHDDDEAAVAALMADSGLPEHTVRQALREARR